LVEILVGAGGWSYFVVPGDRLRSYSEAFRTVEVNSTYYRVPRLGRVEAWRRRVPPSFEFTVRCNQDLTWTIELGSLDACLEVLGRMREVCTVLGARVLHILSPAAFELSGKRVAMIDGLLSAGKLDDLRLAWEIRAGPSVGKERLLRVLQDHGVVHSVDLSRESPAYSSDLAYSRLFGKGEHNVYQFTNSELGDIDKRARSTGAAKVYLNFHGTRMYKDAARISVYEATGTFPKVTRGVGVDSVIEVLGEDAQFPSTTSILLRSQGWKVCEWKADQQLRLSDILSRIEEKRFQSLHDLQLELRNL
jgi:uncharacterized protein YecE (DUF72 family)